MTLEELKEDSLFRALTDRQQNFVLAYAVEGKDHITAAIAAYNCKSRHVARAVAGSALRNSYVQAVIARYSGGEVVTRHQYEALVWKTINSIKVLNVKHDLLVRFGRMKGFLEPLEEIHEAEEVNQVEATPPPAPEPLPTITTPAVDFLAEFKEA